MAYFNTLFEYIIRILKEILKMWVIFRLINNIEQKLPFWKQDYDVLTEFRRQEYLAFFFCKPQTSLLY